MGLRAQPARGADATTRASDHPRHAYLRSSESRRCQPVP